MRKPLLVIMILLMLTIGVGPLIYPPFVSAAVNIIYVDVNAMGGLRDGSSWSNAYNSLQDGLDFAAYGDEIWVAKGTYKPIGWPNGGAAPREKHFSLKTGVGVYGGFEGIETQRDGRDWENNMTILSGDIGIEENNSDNCFHVFYHVTFLDNSAVLDGFTITAGNADISIDPTGCGGGMYNLASSPTLANCSFYGNHAGLYGGGVYNAGSTPILTNCSFLNNSAELYGGGMYNLALPPTLSNCSFYDNFAVRYGGGMCNEKSSPKLVNCGFSGNFADENGGGMCNWFSSSPTLTNCSFSCNSAESYGGGIWNFESSSPTLTNCILWSDSADDSGNEIYNEINSFPIVRYCNIEDSRGSDTGWNNILGIDGGGNIDADPLFVDESYPGSTVKTECDLHLQAGSPCIDSGSNMALVDVTTDFEGDYRILDGDNDGTDTVDMGADEFLGKMSPATDGETPLAYKSPVQALWIGLLAVAIAGGIIAIIYRKVRGKRSGQA